MSTLRQETPEQIHAEAQRWFDALGDPKTTREELAQLDVWLLDPAHALAFEVLLAPVHGQVAQTLMDLGIEPHTDA